MKRSKNLLNLAVAVSGIAGTVVGIVVVVEGAAAAVPCGLGGVGIVSGIVVAVLVWFCAEDVAMSCVRVGCQCFLPAVLMAAPKREPLHPSKVACQRAGCASCAASPPAMRAALVVRETA